MRLLTIALASAATIGFASSAGAVTLGTATLTTATSNFHTHINSQLPISVDPKSTANNVPVVYGTIGIAPDDVTFTGNTDLNITKGNGFASVSDAYPKDNTNLTSLIIDPTSVDFSAIQFSLQFLANTWVDIQYQRAGDATGTWYDVIMGADNPPNSGVPNPFWQTSGTHDYTVWAGQNELLSAVKIITCAGTNSGRNAGPNCDSAGAGFKFEKQGSLLLAGQSPVPEPATWGMMLLGFAGIGVAMRRRRKENDVLMQVA